MSFSSSSGVVAYVSSLRARVGSCFSRGMDVRVLVVAAFCDLGGGTTSGPEARVSYVLRAGC